MQKIDGILALISSSEDDSFSDNDHDIYVYHKIRRKWPFKFVNRYARIFTIFKIFAFEKYS